MRALNCRRITTENKMADVPVTENDSECSVPVPKNENGNARNLL